MSRKQLLAFQPQVLAFVIQLAQGFSQLVGLDSVLQNEIQAANNALDNGQVAVIGAIGALLSTNGSAPWQALFMKARDVVNTMSLS